MASGNKGHAAAAHVPVRPTMRRRIWFTQRRLFGEKCEGARPVTPDFITPVNVADIQIPKQQRKTWTPSPTVGSLIPETLLGMKVDSEFQLSAQKLKEMGQKRLTLEERKSRRRALEGLGVPSFNEFLAQHGVGIKRREAEILQLNIGLYCNQACGHCHVESSPERIETMSAEVAQRCLELLEASPSVTTVDLTGGAPELNAQFRPLVQGVRALEKRTGRKIEVIDRCNLTVLLEPGQEDLGTFLAAHSVRVVASLPCYSAKNVNQQRGTDVFERSIAGLKLLNSLGYGSEGHPHLSLDLVYNPNGAFLPPPQDKLEAKYKEELDEAFGITFNSLFTITNMPIKRRVYDCGCHSFHGAFTFFAFVFHYLLFI